MVALLQCLHCRHGSLGCSAEGGATNPTHKRSYGSGVMRQGGKARRTHKIHTTHTRRAQGRAWDPQAMPQTPHRRRAKTQTRGWPKQQAWAGVGFMLRCLVVLVRVTTGCDKALLHSSGVQRARIQRTRAKGGHALPEAGLTIAPGVCGFQSCEFGPAATSGGCTLQPFDTACAALGVVRVILYVKEQRMVMCSTLLEELESTHRAGWALERTVGGL